MVGNDNDFILQKIISGYWTQIDKAFILALKGFTKKEVRTGKFRTVVASDEVVSNGLVLIFLPNNTKIITMNIIQMITLI